MTCRHPLGTISIFGPETSLAHLDLVSRSASLVLPLPSRTSVMLHRWFLYPVYSRHRADDDQRRGKPASCTLIIQPAATAGHSSFSFLDGNRSGTDFAARAFAYLFPDLPTAFSIRSPTF